MSHPYLTLPPEAFWRSGVADLHHADIGPLWQPRFAIGPDHRIATFGSCFAQHIGRALRRHRFSWIDGEPAPTAFSDEVKHAYGYGLFSARTGNIYTAASLVQWVRWALRKTEMPAAAWHENGGIRDPYRPAIEPKGFATLDELDRARRETLAALRRVLRRADVFVFTLGLTEGWRNRSDGTMLPMCPGTVAGQFDPAEHLFENAAFAEVVADLEEAFALVRAVNSRVRFLLTVSPVPLTATATGCHVLTATTYSKSVLRAAAGEMVRRHADVDYFPSYEIVSAHPYRGLFFEPNMRSVSGEGVDFVMRTFFKAIGADEVRAPAPGDAAAPLRPRRRGTKRRRAEPATVEIAGKAAGSRPGARGPSRQDAQRSAEDVVCDEQMLEAFGRPER